MATTSGRTSPGVVTATTSAEPGDLVALVVGVPGPAFQPPGIDGQLWVDPGTAGIAALGLHSTTMPVAATLNVPAGLQGAIVTWHAVAFGTITGAQVSNPASSIVH